MNPEPYSYGTKINLMPGGRHELLTAYVRFAQNCGDSEYRYACIFPCSPRPRLAKVYSDEIESAEIGPEHLAETERLLEECC